MLRRVLIVDDEPETCALIQKAVSSAGMEALALTNSAQAPGALSQGKYDLVFLDFHMASPDGIELARGMRRSLLNSTTPVVLVSDDQRPRALSVGFDAGANFFIYKPIEKERVLKVVRATQGMADRERRRVRRIPVKRRIVLGRGTEEIEAETIDMSLGGMAVKASRALPLGTFVKLRLHLSEKRDPLIRSGLIVRVSPDNQMGVEMRPLGPTEDDPLQEFLLPLILEQK